MRYAFGAYGTNNVGDDAIFDGIAHEFSNSPVTQIYVNKSGKPGAIWYADLLLGKQRFAPETEELIIGGGGLFHSKNAVLDYGKMADLAISHGIKVTIRGVGAEGITEDFSRETRDLCEKCSTIEVRSKSSQETLKKLGVCSTIRKDFAYNLAGEVLPPAPLLNFDNGLPVVGLVTAGNGDPTTMSRIADMIVQNTVGPGAINIIHIPHSRSYVGRKNNDVATGELLWSSIDIYHASREERFKLSPLFTPLETLAIYSKLDAVIGFRYHSFVFSEVTGTPLLGLTDGNKAKAYFDETNRTDCKEINFGVSQDILLREVRTFINEFIRKK